MFKNTVHFDKYFEACEVGGRLLLVPVRSSSNLRPSIDAI